ncbi:SDR family oxidoreductase [Niveispirillum fermenti]|uniref:SDR family oxidoreductase n=1 Tax=Niveispirillum fermenti TaxID=1233113 RepID=UPI003A884605
MDLGLKGRNAIICAASQGLGRACAMALAREGANVVINGRSQETLLATAADIRREAPDVTVTPVAGDVTEPAVRAALVAASPQVDILVNNNGGPPPGDFRDWDRDAWIRALDANLLTAVELIRMTVDGMGERGFGRIVNITSSAVRVPIPVIGLSNAARSALTGFVLGLVPTVSGKGVTINNLLPGPFDTNRLRQSKAITQHLTKNNVAGRVGDPEEMGAMCAFLCGRYAGYINGQNIQMDGGLYPGNF